MAYKTTKKDFEIFKKEAEKWIEYFGLINYEVFYSHAADENGTAFAWTNQDGRNCTIGLAFDWDEKPKANELKRSAFHEICEVMISPLSDITTKLYNRDFVAGKVHDIIRRLENTIFKESL